MDTSKNSSNTQLAELAEERESLHKMEKLKQEHAALTERNVRIDEQLETIDCQLSVEQIDPSKAALMKNNLKMEQVQIAERIQQLDMLISKLEQGIVASNNYFDKAKCIDNIRELLKNSAVRIGQIEKEAGCTAGYLSRLEKDGNKSNPSIEFLCTAASMLNVTIDTLVKGSLLEMTETEKYLMNFIKQLISDTKREAITWEKESASDLANVGFKEWDFEPEPIADHPLFESYVSPTDDGMVYDTRYVSRFFRHEEISDFMNSYHANIPGTSNELYLMAYLKADLQKEVIYEMYIVDSIPNPICCTVNTCESVKMAIRDLYKEIENMSTHVHIDDSARKVIAQYLEFSEPPF